MNDFVVHAISGSPFARSVLIALEEKGVPYRVTPVVPGTLRSAEHLERHPFGRVPIIDHGDFRLFETQAILRYVDRIYPQPALTPANPKQAARMDQVMNINDWYLFQGVANVIVFQRLIGPRFMGLTPDEASIGAAMPKAKAVFAELARQLGDKPFFASDSLSLADVLVVPQLDYFRATPEWNPLAAPHANLRAWMQRVGARPSLVATTDERVAAMAQAA